MVGTKNGDKQGWREAFFLMQLNSKNSHRITPFLTAQRMHVLQVKARQRIEPKRFNGSLNKACRRQISCRQTLSFLCSIHFVCQAIVICPEITFPFAKFSLS